MSLYLIFVAGAVSPDATAQQSTECSQRQLKILHGALQLQRKAPDMCFRLSLFTGQFGNPVISAKAE